VPVVDVVLLVLVADVMVVAEVSVIVPPVVVEVDIVSVDIVPVVPVIDVSVEYVVAVSVVTTVSVLALLTFDSFLQAVPKAASATMVRRTSRVFFISNSSRCSILSDTVIANSQYLSACLTSSASNTFGQRLATRVPRCGRPENETPRADARGV